MRAAASRAKGASPRARGPPVDYRDKLPPTPVVHFYAAAPVHNPTAVDTGVGMMATYYEELYQTAEKVQAHKRSVANDLFEKARQAHGISLKSIARHDTATCQWHAHDGDPSVVARLGRLADVIVLACPGERSSFADLRTLEQAVFDARRPVLMVPSDASFDPAASLVVAWNGSAEAARVLINAIPLMTKAGQALLVQVGDLESGATPLADAEAYLTLHGIEVESMHLDRGKTSVADTLLAKCEESGAGCLVMGAYTHNPWREMVLGGVTQSMTKHAPLPVFFAH